MRHVPRSGDSENYGPILTEQPRFVRRIPHPDNPLPTTEEDPEAEALISEPPAAEIQGVPRPDVYEEIRKLAALRDEGLITAEEFEVKKRDLLDRI